MSQFRYIVSSVDDSVAFYVDALGFTLMQQYGPAMAIVEHEDLQVWLAGPMASASQAMPDGAKPQPGGWNRIVVQTDDLPSMVEALKSRGVKFRNDILSGPGGSQILCEDPSGNPIELFQPG